VPNVSGHVLNFNQNKWRHMIERTLRKLRAAEFFYRHLVNEARRTSMNEPEAFEHYFSAFLLTARSVPWVMQKEEREKYRVWSPTWEQKLTTEERKLLKLTNRLRIDETHRDGANTIVEWEEIAIHELLGANLDLERPHPSYHMHWSAQPGVPSAKARRPAYYLEHEDGKAEVTAMCKQYLDYLEKLVREFLLAHDQKPAS
jgi:hypothetical protein